MISAESVWRSFPSIQLQGKLRPDTLQSSLCSMPNFLKPKIKLQIHTKITIKMFEFEMLLYLHLLFLSANCAQSVASIWTQKMYKNQFPCSGYTAVVLFIHTDDPSVHPNASVTLAN